VRIDRQAKVVVKVAKVVKVSKVVVKVVGTVAKVVQGRLTSLGSIFSTSCLTLSLALARRSPDTRP
jgi:hypothetical protein